jgi:hypothetical protein
MKPDVRGYVYGALYFGAFLWTLFRHPGGERRRRFLRR